MATKLTLGTYGEAMDLKIRQGATFGPFKFVMKSPNGRPVDLTGCSFLAQIRKKADSKVVVAMLAFSVTDAVNGLYEFILNDTATMGIPCGDTAEDLASKYVWDCELHDSQGGVIPLYYGNCYIFREVSRGN